MNLILKMLNLKYKYNILVIKLGALKMYGKYSIVWHLGKIMWII